MSYREEFDDLEDQDDPVVDNDDLRNFLPIEPLVEDDYIIRSHHRWAGFSEFRKLIPSLLGTSVSLSEALIATGYRHHLHDRLLLTSISIYLREQHRVEYSSKESKWIRRPRERGRDRHPYVPPVSTRPIWDQFDEHGYKLREPAIGRKCSDPVLSEKVK